MPRRNSVDEHSYFLEYHPSRDGRMRWACTCGSRSAAWRTSLDQARQGHRRHYDRMVEQGLVRDPPARIRVDRSGRVLPAWWPIDERGRDATGIYLNMRYNQQLAIRSRSNLPPLTVRGGVGMREPEFRHEQDRMVYRWSKEVWLDVQPELHPVLIEEAQETIIDAMCEKWPYFDLDFCEWTMRYLFDE